MRFDPGSDRTDKEAGGMRRRLVLNIAAFAVVLYTFFFILSICGISVMGSHIPNEYREPANFDLTLSFIKGINPYAAESLDGEVPGCVFQYGPLFSLLTAGVHFIIPFVDVFELHYFIAFICILTAAVMAAAIAYEKSVTLAPPACVFLLTIACTWRYGYINAVPDTLGVTLLVLIFFIETRKDMVCREYIEAAVSVALFYTKQYFVIIALSLFLFKFITDKRAWIKLSVAGLIMLAASVFIVNAVCPLYFTYSLLIVHGVSGQSVAATRPLFSKLAALPFSAVGLPVWTAASEAKPLPPTGWAFEILQLKSLTGIFLFVFIGMAAGVVRAFLTKTPRFEASRLFVIHSMVAFAALLFLGQNDGAWLSYYLQLLMPSVIIYSFISAEKDVLDGRMTRYYKWAYMVLMLLMIMYTTYRVDSRLPYYDKSDSVMREWDKAYRYCDAYASRGDILYRAPLGINALANGRYLYDNGHEMAIHQRFLDEYNSSSFYQKVFPLGGKLMEQHIRYRDLMKEKVREGGYSLVLTTATDGELVSVEDLEYGGYLRIDRLTLDTGWAAYEVDFWVPSEGDKPSFETKDWT